LNESSRCNIAVTDDDLIVKINRSVRT